MKYWGLASFVIAGIMLGTFPIHAQDQTIYIPHGAYNPELNTPAEVWYDPPVITISEGDSITWYNDDAEAHTVTSGESSGRFGWMDDDFGTPDGMFDSGLFVQGNTWTYKFESVGTFQYFCVIHPWMEGLVLVTEKIPKYPHDSSGKQVEFPLVQYTPDRDIEVDLAWSPHVIKTHEKIQFVYQFYDPNTNSNLANMKYDIMIFQNGKQIFADSGKNQIGGDFRNIIFDQAGPIIIRLAGIEKAGFLTEESVTVSGNVENKAQRSVDYTAIVYENEEKSSHTYNQVKPAQRLEIYYELAITLILVPAILFILVILWMKRKPKVQEYRSSPV